MKPPVIFDYLDYRAFLKDMFLYRKQQVRHFSYRFFSRKSGFKSPNFLKLVAEGQRNLTRDSIPKIAKGFDLKKQEKDFFEYLVLMNQADSHEDKNRFYRKMMDLKGYRSIRTLEKALYDYFSKWYIPVIREILMFGERRQTAEEVAPLLNPAITPAEARTAIASLLELELIRKDESGKWTPVDRNLTTGPEIRSLVVANFHREMIRLAGESLERHPAKERDITGLVLSVRKDRMNEIKKKTAAFRKELLELASGEEQPDQVVQVNIQVFPLTKPLTKQIKGRKS